jgi:hypothetical protein
LEIVSERRSFVLIREADGKKFIATDGDFVVWVLLDCIGGRSSLLEVEDTAGMATFSWRVGSKQGEDGVSGRNLDFRPGLTTWISLN